jgi:hypothetical protein
MFTLDELAALREQARHRTDRELFATRDQVKFFNGGEWVFGKLTADSKGSFHGKQGSPKRSRKGRTVIQANGTRQYHPWNPDEVQAYQA